MMAGVITAKNKVEFREVPDPAPAPGHAVIKVKYSGYCGPTEQAIIEGLHPRAAFPLINGHEFCGQVSHVGEGSTFKIGDRVAVFPLLTCGVCYACKNGRSYICTKLNLIGIDCDGGFAQYCRVPEANLIRLPDSVSDKAAALTEAVAVCLHAVRDSFFRTGDDALVVGAGPIGMFTAECLRIAGAGRVVIAEIDARRCDFARSCGYEVVSGIGKLGKEAMDCVFETSGAAAVLPGVVDAVKISGFIAIVGKFDFPAEVNLHDVLFKEITIKGYRVYRESEFQQALDLIALDEQRFTRFITDEYSLEQYPQAVKDFVSRKNLCKIMITV